MKVFVEKVSFEDFEQVATDAHLYCFNELRPKGFNRYDYALLCHNDEKGPTAYATIIEHDADSAYMQHGGAFPIAEKSILAVKSYLLMIEWLRSRYKTISTRIFNDNIEMIKFAHLAGFKINGVEYFKNGEILLCFRMEITDI